MAGSCAFDAVRVMHNATETMGADAAVYLLIG
jgi:hypothetical protein